MPRNGRKMPIRHALFVRLWIRPVLGEPVDSASLSFKSNPNHQIPPIHKPRPTTLDPLESLSGNDCVICGMQRASIALACNKFTEGGQGDAVCELWSSVVHGALPTLRILPTVRALPIRVVIVNFGLLTRLKWISLCSFIESLLLIIF